MGIRVINVRGFCIETILHNDKVHGFSVRRRDFVDGEKKAYGPSEHFRYFSDAARYVANERYPNNENKAMQFALFLTDEIYAEGEF